MIVQQLVPQANSVEVNDIVELLNSASQFPPFSEELTTLFDSLSAALFSDAEAKRFPELQALAFFIRRSAIRTLHKDFIKASERADLVSVPMGRVFHLAPGNVDTLFVYSWFLSAITGNTNIIRLSQRTSEPAVIICRLLNQLLAASSEKLRRSVIIISYGHDEEITKAISQVIDLRVIWGGDHSVSSIRKASLPVHARELVFPDRYSVAAIKTKAYEELDSEAKLRLIHEFFNDSYWFDQAACSSPRQIFFVGEANENKTAAAHFQMQLQDELVRRNFQLEPAASIEKLTDVYDCLLQTEVDELHYHTNELAVLDLPVATLPSVHGSRGTFYCSTLVALDQLLPALTRKVQTLTYFGFEQEELRSFAQKANGQGIDRMVPIGQALSFDRFWDGLDLVAQFTRLVNIK